MCIHICINTQIFFFFLDRVLLLLSWWLQTPSPPVSATALLELTGMCPQPWHHRPLGHLDIPINTTEIRKKKTTVVF